MTPENERKIQEELQEIAKILYEEADKEELTSLAGIETTVRRQTLEHVTPQLGAFFWQKRQEQQPVEEEQSRV